jgi:aerobic carbon-monoxide dehydrogenase medium subunit
MTAFAPVKPTYHYPDSLAEVCRLLADGEESMVYGGGTAIQILIKQGVLFATDLVDISRVPGLAEITATATGVRLGPLVSLRRVETSPEVAAIAPLAAEVYGHVANPRVRNTASAGGNIAHGDYRLDPPTALLVLDATVELTSVEGTRTVPAREFFVDFQQTALRHGEVITGIEIPRQPESAGAAFCKLSSLSVNDWPCASASALVVEAGKGKRQLRLGLGALAHIPLHTELELPSDTSRADAVAAAVAAAAPLIDPIPDVRGSSEFKKKLGLHAVSEAVADSWKEQQDDRRSRFSKWRSRR